MEEWGVNAKKCLSKPQISDLIQRTGLSRMQLTVASSNPFASIIDTPIYRPILSLSNDFRKNDEGRVTNSEWGMGNGE
jgi:hypothetical protein